MKKDTCTKYIPAALFIALLIRPELFTPLFRNIASALSPLLSGVILAAVICPAVSSCEKIILKLRHGRRDKWIRPAAVAVVYIAIAAVFAGAVWIIMPKLIDSAMLFANSFGGYYDNLRRHAEAADGTDFFGLYSRLDDVISLLSDKLPEFFEKTFTATAGFIRRSADILLGLVLSVYILADRERLCGFASSAVRSVTGEKHYKRLSYAAHTVYRCLSDFVSGQIAEAVLLGTLCFAGMVIFDFEYPLLISTIIGVTALVPVAGAIVGTVPSALMLFLAKPSSALWFVVFIIVLQQLENNLIYPKIVGKSVGLPPILILTAIIIGAKLGGAVGIMLGIPLLAAVYVIFTDAVGKNLSNHEEN